MKLFKYYTLNRDAIISSMSQEKLLLKVVFENGFENRSTAWALDFPGCFAYGSNETEALIRMTQALVNYKAWLEGFTESSWLQDLSDFDIRLVETYQFHYLNDQYEPATTGKEAGAWFHYDWLPLDATEIQHGLAVLAWAHEDLFELVAALSEAQLDRTYAGERWSIRGILLHVANSEAWYLERLFLMRTPSEDISGKIWPKLKNTLEQYQSSFPSLIGKELVYGREGEFWSPRKVMRRACWHVLDHCQHIHRLITS